MKQDFKTVMQCILLLFGIVICMLVCDSDRIREEDYINRIYVVDQGDACGYEFSIYITELDDEHMEGYGNRYRKA